MENLASTTQSTTQTADRTLSIYADKLINLNGRNSLIWMAKPSKTKHLDIGGLDFLSKSGQRNIVMQIWEDKKVRLFEHTDARSEATSKASTSLKNIQRATRQIEEESGSYDLKLGFPFVMGRMANGTSIHAPLMLFPVELIVEKNYWVLKPKENEPAEINKSFLLSYQQNNGLATIPEEILNLSSDDIIDEVNYFLVNLYNKLKEANIDIRIKNSIFEEKIEPYTSHTKETFEKVFNIGNLEMIDEAVIGIFPQAGGYLVSDYNELKKENNVSINSIFNKFNREIKSSGYIAENEIMLPLPCDASQENIIKKVINKQSLVVQGPPGTGKSQLIANLVAGAMYKGQKVLVVCQKRAALEVVKERISTINLSDYLGLVQDLQHDRQSLFEQIDRQISSYVEKPRSQSDKNNFQLLQDEFTQVSLNIDKIHTELLAFQQELSKIQDCGFSIKELYLKADRKEQQLLLADIFKYFTKNALENFIKKLQKLKAIGQNFPKNGIWRNLKSLHFLKKETLAESLNEFRNNIQWLYRNKEIISKKKNAITEEIRVQKSLLAYYNNSELVQQLFKYWHNAKLNGENIQALYNEIVIEKKTKHFKKLSQDEFEAYSLQFEKYSKHLHNANWIFQQLEEEDFQSFYKTSLKAFEDSTKKYFSIAELQDIYQKRKGIEEKITNLTGKSKNNYCFQWDEQSLLFQEAIDYYGRYTENNNVLKYFIQEKNDFEGAILELQTFVNELNKVVSNALEWMQEPDVELILSFPNQEIAKELSELSSNLLNWFEADDILHNFNTEEKKSYQYYLEDGDLDRFIRIFNNSIYTEWIDFIEFRNPALKTADFIQAEQRDAILQSLIERKQQLSKMLLPAYLDEMVENLVPHQHREKRTFFNKLLREVRKKSHRWPIRRLLNTFSMEMNALVPCWLATPEMVSALFPLNQSFDLVIFDEASQCFAERGIPAIYRAKQLIVAGDDKQLQPNRMFSTMLSVDEDDLDLNEDEVGTINIESLLKLCSNFLGNDTLKQHYRSRTIDLIAFSNAKFYESKLQMIPHSETVQNSEVNLQFIKVRGIWENNSNVVEAEKVIELLREIHLQYPSKSVGIVCFNIHQQNLLLDLIEQSDVPIPPQLFVKNIENVQGDERDIIILSVTYAYDKNGRFNRHFGDLSQQGGENKLNVAITRSRERMMVISSISQSDIGASNSNGGRLLAEFLGFLELQSKQSDQFGGLEHLDNVNTLEQNALGPVLSKVIEREVKSLPFADLSIRKDDNNYLLVFTDDIEYQRESNLKQRHAYLPIQLLSKGWEFRKVYSRQWWSNPSSVIKHLE